MNKIFAFICFNLLNVVQSTYISSFQTQCTSLATSTNIIGVKHMRGTCYVLHYQATAVGYDTAAAQCNDFPSARNKHLLFPNNNPILDWIYSIWGNGDFFIGLQTTSTSTNLTYKRDTWGYRDGNGKFWPIGVHNNGFTHWAINEPDDVRPCAYAHLNSNNHAAIAYNAYSGGGFYETLCVGGYGNIYRWVCQYSDDARHFSGKYIGQRLASQFIASGNLTVTNAFDKVMVCATYCIAASPCRSFGVSESTGECELYLVDDTYALFATTWMSTNATWTIFIPE